MSGLMQFFRGQNKALRTALFVTAFLSGVAFGQSEVGTISGKVADPNGAVVPGATIKAKSVETGFERAAVVDSDGFYILRSLPPGVYEINVTVQGFAAQTQKVRVYVGSIIRYDPELTVQPVTGQETIIESSDEAINNQTPQISDLITGRQLVQLPTITRDPFALITLSGNVTPFMVNPLGARNQPTVITQPFQDFAIDGQAPTTNNVRLDGGENIINYWSTLGQRLPLPGVQEINVITNGFRPEYGRLLGGLIDVASRQGSNDWNGSVYYFYRGDALAGNSFDSNARGIPTGHLVGNQPGVSIGGPIVKDKFFFFTNFEGIVQRSRIDRVSFVPAAAFLDPVTNPAISPATTAYFAAFPLAPPARIGRTLTVADTLGLLGQPVAGGAFSALPPDTPAFTEVFFNTANDWGIGPPQNTLLNVTRLDYTLDDNDWIYGRYAYVSRDIFNGAFSFSPFAGFNTGIYEQNHNIVLNWMHAFNDKNCCQNASTANWILNGKVQYERVNLFRQVGANTFGPRLLLTGYQSAAFGGVQTAFPGDLPFDPALNSTLTGPLNLGQAAVDAFGTWKDQQLRFGASYYYWQDNRTVRSFQNGNYTLQGGALLGLDSLVTGTADTFSTAINPFGALPGDPITFPITAPDFNRSLSAHDFSLYVSDIWRIRPRLSLTLGLRYDYFGVPRGRTGQVFQNFFPGPGSSIFDQIATGTLAAPNDLLPSGSVLNDRFFQRDWNNFGPRIGIAWDVSGGGYGCCKGTSRRTTLRAGYGITYDRLFYGVSPFFQSTANFAIPYVTAGVPFGGGTIPATPLSTSNFGPAGGPLVGATVVPPFLVRGIETELRAPMLHFWNVSLEREIFTNTVAALQYVGAAGRNLFTLSNVNRPGSAAAFLDPAAPPTARLNPAFGPIFFLTDDGRSNFNAFIAEITNSTYQSLGLQFTARYRYAKALDNISGIFGNNIGNFGGSFTPNLLSPFDPNFDYGPSDWDLRHRFVGSFNWEVPFDWFTNRCCGGSSWAKQALGGWQVAGIMVAQSGLPYTPFNCANTFSAETPCPRAGLAPGITISDNVNGNGGSQPSTTIPNFFNYLNGTAFVPVTSVATNTALPPFPDNTPGRNAFRGPGFWNFEFGVYKRFKITEDVSFQFRSEFYNLFNNANLFVPTGVDVGANPFVPAFKNGARFIQFGGILQF
ncbi:MAG: carboxypeptidase regulatory-like domain-containing protein [Blastocatellales bacterium]